MRGWLAIFLLAFLGCGFAVADEVPLPRPRPDIRHEPLTFADANPGLFDTAELTADPTECQLRVEKIAEVEPLPRLIGPGACGGGDMLRINAVLLPDHARVELKPAPVLRCRMAESLAAWVHDEVAPRVAKLGTSLRSVTTFDDYECRGRNRIANAKLSEHGKGNAVDIRAFNLADGRAIELVDVHADKQFRQDVRQSVCTRFMTVLGPGSDAYHESHIHLDVAERSRGYRICQWDVREPPPPAEVASSNAVPLPAPRPQIPAENAPDRKL